MMGLLFKPFTNAEPGTFGELLEVIGFIYCFTSIVIAPVMWLAIRGLDDANRLRRTLMTVAMVFIWPIVVIRWIAQRAASYFAKEFQRELRDMMPPPKPKTIPRSPSELHLYE